MNKKIQEYEGKVKKIIWSSKNSDYVILALTNEMVCKGKCTPGDIVEKLCYRFVGSFVEDKKHGQQFEFSGYVPIVGRDSQSVVEYLVKTCPGCGIGPATSRKLVDYYGPENVIAAIRSRPAEVASKISSLTEQNMQKAASLLEHASKWEATRIELMSMFHGRGFTLNTIQFCIERWGIYAPTKIKRDPLCLLIESAPAAGFARVSALYNDLGHSPRRLRYQMVCLWNCMKNNSGGSVWFERSKVKQMARENLTDSSRISRAVKLGIKTQWFAARREGDNAFLAVWENAHNEEVISTHLRRIVSAGTSGS